MKQLQNDYNKAVKRLKEVLALEKSEITRDSAIKRFEICFDLSWKLIKAYARREGIECNSPRSCFRTAYQLRLIKYNDAWLKMIDDRNRTVHLYDETVADQVYPKLKTYLSLFEELRETIADFVKEKS